MAYSPIPPYPVLGDIHRTKDKADIEYRRKVIAFCQGRLNRLKHNPGAAEEEK